MECIYNCELQIDKRTNGYTIRVNGKDRCLLRICGIPIEVVENKNRNIKEFIDFNTSSM